MASVVNIRDAIEAAFCKAERVTTMGSYRGRMFVIVVNFRLERVWKESFK
jgi:hypothetical protein